MNRKVVSGIVVTLLLESMILFAFNAPIFQIARVKAVAQPTWWFDYSTMSVCWLANTTTTLWMDFLIDLDGDHLTGAFSNYGGWDIDYGTIASLQTYKRKYHDGGCTTWFGHAFNIGEKKIDEPGYAHINTTYAGHQTEGFYFWVPKTDPPTDWVICLKRSDGTNPLPITSTFWYSVDQGRTWNSFTPTLPATVDVHPNTLNLKSKGRWITAHIELPEDYNLGDIDISTVRLEGEISAEIRSAGIRDYEIDGNHRLMVKFDRQEVVSLLSVGEVTLTITGEVAGTPFEGSDTVRVIDK